MGKKANDISKSYRLSCSFLQKSNNNLLWAAKMLEEAGERCCLLCKRKVWVSLRRKADVGRGQLVPYAFPKGGGKTRARLGLEMI